MIMRQYRADLHIHTTLSPCGDLEMSPVNIVMKSIEMKLDIIGITDHNSTLQCRVVKAIGERSGLTVLMGVEVNTKEEVHCLVFFEEEEELAEFQHFLDQGLPDIKNDVKRFGYQVVADENEQITYSEERLLISALKWNLHETEQKAHALNGLVIPAHIDKAGFSILGQLGFVPPDFHPDALEISPFISPVDFLRMHNELKKFPLVSGSDAHYLHQVGTRVTSLELENPQFANIRAALCEKSSERIKIIN